jgi:Lipocalin-like domain
MEHDAVKVWIDLHRHQSGGRSSTRRPSGERSIGRLPSSGQISVTRLRLTRCWDENRMRRCRRVLNGAFGEADMKCTATALFPLLTASLLSGGASAQTKTLKEQLLGEWDITTWVQTYPNGHKLQAFGPHPKGVVTFDADGHFSNINVDPDLPKIASTDRFRPTSDEAMAVAKGTLAYYGTYTVDEPSKTIIFNIEASSFANQVGIPAKRIVTKIDDMTLSYRNPAAVSGGIIETSYKRAQ